MTMNLSKLARDLEPFLLPRLRAAGSSLTVGTGGLSAHALSGPYHTGTLAESQAPWAVTRTAFAAHASNPDAHHAKQHAITDGSHHTVVGSQWGVVGLSATNTIGILASSSSPGVTEQLLRSASDGSVNLRTLISSLNGTTGGAIVQGVVEADTNFARAWFGHNAQYDSTSNLWTMDAIGANDAAGVFIPNSSSSIDLIFHPSTGNTTRTMDHATFTSGAKFRFGNNGRLAVNSTDISTYTLKVAGTVSASGVIYAGSDLEMTGELLAADGSAAAPSMAFLADTNTGLYRSGPDAFSLVAGGSAIINVGTTGIGLNTPSDSTAALKVMSAATDDISLFLKQQSGQTARMLRVEDSAGLEMIVLDSQGNLQSGNPGFVSGLTGWQMTPTGNLEANNAWIRGELHASIFVMDEFHASGGTLYIAPAGKLENNATVWTTGGVESVFDIRTTSATGTGTQFDIRTTSVTGTGAQFTLRTIENYFEITDPPSGHATIFEIGDTLRLKSLGNPGAGINLYDVWGTVTRVENMTDYYRYYYTRQSGGSNGIIIPAGAAVISYGAQGDGRIFLTSDQNYAPYLQVFTNGAQPWNGQITPTVRLGRLDGVGLPGVSGIEQYGLVLSSDLSNASAPYLVASNLQMFSYKIDSEWNNGNPTARITANGAMRLGTDVDADATTGLKFDPTTGALTIGSASYSGAVTVYGNVTVTSGSSGYTNFSDKPTSLAAINATEGTKLNTAINTAGNLVTSVIPATAITPGGAGLYLGSNYMGYYNGSAWKTYTDSSGNWRLLGNASNTYIQWVAASNRLQGVGAGVEQWYADATDGKFYAANGTIGMDSTGLWLRMNASSSWATAKAITFRNASTWSTVDAVLSTKTVLSSRYLSLLIDPNTVPVGLEIIASPAAQRVNITHDLTVTGTVASDLDMNGNNIIDANNVWAVRSTAPL